VLEIGSSLREARERLKLELSQVEGATRILARHLQAFEDERFDILPGGVREGAPADVRGLPRARRAAIRRRVQHPLRSHRGAAGHGSGQDPAPSAPAGPRLLIVPVALAVGPGRLRPFARRRPPSHGIQSAPPQTAGQYRDASSGSAHYNQAEERTDRTRGRAVRAGSRCEPARRREGPCTNGRSTRVSRSTFPAHAS
jgi:hypothetical protein